MRSKFESTAVHYKRTGIIPEALLKIFVQNGHYRGLEHYDEIDRDTLDELKRTILTPAQTATRNKNGNLILLTSFEWDLRGPHTVPWHQVMRAAFRAKSKEIRVPPFLNTVLELAGKKPLPAAAFHRRLPSPRVDTPRDAPQQ